MVMKIANTALVVWQKVLIGDKEGSVTMFESVISKIIDGVTGDN